MKTILLASTALFFAFATQAGATAPMGEHVQQISTAKLITMQLADNGSDDNGGGDDHGGNSGNDGDDSNSGSDSDDDNGGSSSDSDDDNSSSKSKRQKERVPGGSGCDGAGDATEHAGCNG